ncbi:MAG: MarR family transcriptional regulator [Rhodobacteraceae bacterium]|nr:MAG: MarR family transcriptional regulator [Paracoccaceae bacterium]
MIDNPEELEDFTPYLMNRIMARYNKGVEAALKEVGVSVAQMRALAVLAEGGPCTINELSVMTVIKQSTLSRTLDAMEAAGLIRREAGETDSRIRKIHLTETGAAAYRAAWPAMEHMRDTMLASLSEAERATLKDMLSRVLHDIRHHDF